MKNTFRNYHIEALKLTAAFIANSQRFFVCTALKDVSDNSQSFAEKFACWQSRRLVLRSIGDDDLTVLGWMDKNHPDLYAEYFENCEADAIIEYRLAWINWMIEGWDTSKSEYPRLAYIKKIICNLF